MKNKQTEKSYWFGLSEAIRSCQFTYLPPVQSAETRGTHKQDSLSPPTGSRGWERILKKKAAAEGSDNFSTVSLCPSIEPLLHALWMTSLEEDVKETGRNFSLLSLSLKHTGTHMYPKTMVLNNLLSPFSNYFPQISPCLNKYHSICF